jgi:hypothetical protein
MRETNPTKLAARLKGTHHKTGTLTYKRWKTMRKRVLIPEGDRWDDYGGRGITMHQPWNDFEVFLADVGECPSPEYTLDRYPDTNGNYEPGNVRWATRSQQQRNRRDSTMLTFKDRTQNMYDWADETGFSIYVIRSRVRLGWSAERILTEPVNEQYSKNRRKSFRIKNL